MKTLIQIPFKAFFWMLLRFLYRVKVRGMENIPKSGAAILAPNHVSYIDALLIAAHIGRPIRFAMYWTIYNKLKWLVAPLGAFPIAGKENVEIYKRAFEIMNETLEDGGLLCIFPEGMLTTDGNMNVFKNGILKVLRSHDVPVVPIGLNNLWGSYFSKKKPGLFKLPEHFMAKITMNVGEPRHVVELKPLWDDVRALAYSING